ncbi:MAG: ABC transporter permease [Chthoniobacterales bacterium]|nr:ABC transporter permease [Chthoniobacterales bacterium]
MTATFWDACESEWLKRKRSLASCLVVAGGFFTPTIVLVARLVYPGKLPKIYSAAGFWNDLWTSSWESMAIFFLPMGAILAASLMAQIEFKNNAWKQVHASPLSLSTIFFSKLAVVLVMMGQFFALFNVAIYLSAVLPALLLRKVPYPSAPIPWARFLKDDALFFIDCLPIVAAQYLISLRYRNFLVPIGAGFLIWVGALGSLSWKFGYVVPYIYPMLNYLKNAGTGKAAIPLVNIHLWSLGYFFFFTFLGLGLFVTRREKG